MQPLHDDIHDIGLLVGCELATFGYAMPLLKTVAATAARGMLRDEWREDAMAHGRLAAVVGNISGSQPAGYDLGRISPQLGPAFLLDIATVLGVEIKTASEL